MAAALCLFLFGIVLTQTVSYVAMYHKYDTRLTRYTVYVTVLFCSGKAGHLLYIAVRPNEYSSASSALI